MCSEFNRASNIFDMTEYYDPFMCADQLVQREPLATVADMRTKLSIPQVLVIKEQYDPATPCQQLFK